MKFRKKVKSDSLSPNSEYLHLDEAFQNSNYDTYRTTVTSEPDEKEVTKKWSRRRAIFHLLFSIK